MQVLCRALGGKVGKSYTGWDVGLRKVSVVKELAPCCFLEELGEIPASLSVIECHQDEVFEVPLGAEVIASSDKTGVEMFKIGSHILGIQGHPEYTKDILQNLIDRLLNMDAIEVINLIVNPLFVNVNLLSTYHYEYLPCFCLNGCREVLQKK